MMDKLKPYESAHITVITLWLFEIFEKQLTELKNDHNKKVEYHKVQNEFQTFLSHSAVMVSIFQPFLLVVHVFLLRYLMRVYMIDFFEWMLIYVNDLCFSELRKNE